MLTSQMLVKCTRFIPTSTYFDRKNKGIGITKSKVGIKSYNIILIAFVFYPVMMVVIANQKLVWINCTLLVH